MLQLGERPAVVARLYFDGKSPDWLKKLERDGIIPPAPRSPNGYRFYPPDYLEQIKSILTRREGRDAS